MWILDTCDLDAVVDQHTWFYHFHRFPVEARTAMSPRLFVELGDATIEFTAGWSLRLFGLQITRLGTKHL